MKLKVKIDISGNTRFIDEVSVLGVATENGEYKKNIFLEPKIKRRITNYANKYEEIHTIMIYNLIKNEMKKYSLITFCHDINKNKLKNYLRKLFKNNSYWQELDINKKIKIHSVKNSFVDKYVKNVRKHKEKKGFRLTLKRINKQLKIFEKKNKSRHK